MAIVEYKGSDDPRAVIAKIERKNCKNELARALYNIYADTYAVDKPDNAIVEQIRERIRGVL